MLSAEGKQPISLSATSATRLRLYAVAKDPGRY